MSQQAVAERMGVSESRVTQIENTDGASLTLRSLLRFASAIECRVDIDLVDARTNRVASSVLVSDDMVPEPSPAKTFTAEFSQKVSTLAEIFMTGRDWKFKDIAKYVEVGCRINKVAQPQTEWVTLPNEGERVYAGV